MATDDRREHEKPMPENVDDAPQSIVSNHDAADSPWTTHTAQETYRNPWLHVVEYGVTRPDGNAGIYGVVYPGNNASVVALDSEEQVYLVGGFFYSVQHFDWSLPSGKVEEHEEPLFAAQRELREEAGIVADQWDLLGKYYLSPGFTPQASYIFLARELHQGIPQPEGTEQFIIERRPLREAVAACQRNELSNAATVLGIWHAWLFLHGLFDAMPSR